MALCNSFLHMCIYASTFPWFFLGFMLRNENWVGQLSLEIEEIVKGNVFQIKEVSETSLTPSKSAINPQTPKR